MITNNFDRLMTGLVGRNWRTTTAGLISLASGVFLTIATRPEGEAIAITLAKFVAIGGLSSIGIQAKDHSVTGTRR